MRILYEGQARKYDAAILAVFATIIERSAYKARSEVAGPEGLPSSGNASR
jgi:hypothetical protein